MALWRRGEERREEKHSMLWYSGVQWTWVQCSIALYSGVENLIYGFLFSISCLITHPFVNSLSLLSTLSYLFITSPPCAFFWYPTQLILLLILTIDPCSTHLIIIQTNPTILFHSYYYSDFQLRRSGSMQPRGKVSTTARTWYGYHHFKKCNSSIGSNKLKCYIWCIALDVHVRTCACACTSTCLWYHVRIRISY